MNDPRVSGGYLQGAVLPGELALGYPTDDVSGRTGPAGKSLFPLFENAARL